MLFVLLQLLKLCHCTHSTDARGQDHPAPFDEEDRFVPNHVFNIKVESVTTWKKKYDSVTVSVCFIKITMW